MYNFAGENNDNDNNDFNDEDKLMESDNVTTKEMQMGKRNSKQNANVRRPSVVVYDQPGNNHFDNNYKNDLKKENKSLIFFSYSDV